MDRGEPGDAAADDDVVQHRSPQGPTSTTSGQSLLRGPSAARYPRHIMKHRFITIVVCALALAACDRGSDPSKKNAPNAEKAAKDEGAKDAAPKDAEVDFPAYPKTDGGILWLKSKGGPLGETTFQAQPREERWDSGGYFYAQSEAEGRQGEALTYNLRFKDLPKGTHPLDGKVTFYVGDGSTGTYKVTGTVRIDAIDTDAASLRCVLTGDAKNDKSGESSPIDAAIILTGK